MRADEALASGGEAQGVVDIQPTGVGGQAVPGGADGGDGEGEAKIGCQAGCFALQQAGEGLADVAKSEQGEVIVGHGIIPGGR